MASFCMPTLKVQRKLFMRSIQRMYLFLSFPFVLRFPFYLNIELLIIPGFPTSFDLVLYLKKLGANNYFVSLSPHLQKGIKIFVLSLPTL